ncbi:unnamed protein product [Cylicocyclus nassatus]|uniref:Uncharacterized protein n=1 Tax=Cylicocyclus nassatus TaxID=53992 RepID=A0AA36GE62_CYLNA|nr:unnamed protein product [Cylicocyclus nassatus]
MSLRFVVFATLFAPSVASGFGNMTAVEFCQNSLHEPQIKYRQTLATYFGFARVKYGKLENMTWFEPRAYEAQLCFSVKTPDCVPVNYTEQTSAEAIAVKAAKTYDARLAEVSDADILKNWVQM